MWAAHQLLTVRVTATEVAIGVALVTADQRRAYRDQLAPLRRNVERLGPTGELGRQLLAGTFAPASWAGLANFTGTRLDDLQVDLAAGDLAVRVWKELVVPTAADVAKGVEGTAAAIKDHGPGLAKWLVVGLVAYAVAQVAGALPRGAR